MISTPPGGGSPRGPVPRGPVSTAQTAPRWGMQVAISGPSGPEEAPQAHPTPSVGHLSAAARADRGAETPGPLRSVPLRLFQIRVHRESAPRQRERGSQGPAMFAAAVVLAPAFFVAVGEHIESRFVAGDEWFFEFARFLDREFPLDRRRVEFAALFRFAPSEFELHALGSTSDGFVDGA